MLRSIMYYTESDTLAELIKTMDKEELTFDILTYVIDYIYQVVDDGCLTYYIQLGNTLTYSQYDRISYCLSDKMRQKIESEMKFK